MNSNLRTYIIKLTIISYVLLFSSCNITKFLNEDEYLIEDVSLDLNCPERSSEISVLKAELSRLYQVNENNDFQSYNYFKYKDKDVEDLGWIKRYLKNKKSTEPSLVDSTKISETAISIKNYLRNKKGFYDAETDYTISQKNNSAKVKFIANTGRRYTVNSIHHIAQDSTLKEVLENLSKNSLIQVDNPLDALSFEVEKQRIIKELQNMGYAYINNTNVDIKGDSTGLDKQWDVFIVVKPDVNGDAHKKFTNGEISVYTDYHREQQPDDLKKEELLSKNFYRQSSDFIVRPTTINRKIFLNQHRPYKADDYYKTIRKLNSLGAYRFVKLNSTTSQDSVIDYEIFLTPHQHKWILDTGSDIFFSNISRISNDLVGMAVSTSLENRNAFGGSEKINTSAEIGIEVNPANFEINTLSLGLNNALEIPSLTKPFNVLRPLNKFGLITKRAMTKLEEEGKSTFSLGFNYLDILNYYNISSVNADYGYDLNIDKRHRLTFKQTGFEYTNYNIPAGGEFDTILLNNPVLKRSFVTTLFTGLMFKDLTYYYQSERGQQRSNFAVISRLELSGLEVYLANKIYNGIANKTSPWTFVNDIEFEKFVKLEFDARWYMRKRARSQLAARFKAGAIIPFGEDNSVSYVKQYFIGGPSSIRAWRPMHLGPGTYLRDDTYENTDSTIFFQRADLLLDFSLEYRFDLFWLLEGALFFDGGNIWTLYEDIDRPGSNIGSQFYNSLALGYGYGFRFDFTYFIIRFDLGFKLKYPVANPDTNSPWVKLKGQSLGNFNIAVNYPF